MDVDEDSRRSDSINQDFSQRGQSLHSHDRPQELFQNAQATDSLLALKNILLDKDRIQQLQDSRDREFETI
jgi:hypothetical protein